MVEISVKNIKKRAQKEIEKAQNLKELEEIFKAYLSRTGEVTKVLRSLKEMSQSAKKKIGREANEAKNFLEELIAKKSQEMKSEEEAKKDEWFDVTVPGKKIEEGHLHPLTQTREKIIRIFENMGFSVIDGPQMEEEWYNFDALNFPKDHPAREMQDTLFIKQKNREALPDKKKLLMRTHTSPVQVRFMEKNQPPFRIIVPGRVFRHEATDARHEINFYQVEGLMIGRDVSVANFKAVAEEFFKRFFERPLKIRLRPSFFPFTEPSFEADVECVICNGKGCSTCGQSGWLEVFPGGMVHPNVIKSAGLNPKNWQGFAFGMGMDRMAMLKYKIDDIRLFCGGDLRFLKQF